MTIKPGAYTALITPFTSDGTQAVDEAALRRIVERQIDMGIDGLVPCGTTGEAATMTDAECMDVIRIVVDQAAGRVPVIAGTGSNDTAATIAFTKEVAEMGGVDAALVVTPYYNKPNQAGLIAHYRAVADEGGLDVIMYNVPGRTSVSMTAQTVATLAEHPRILAVKDATADMGMATRLKELCPSDFHLWSGDDFTTFPLLAIGGTGCISVTSNILPDKLALLCQAVRDKDLDRARSLHLAIQPLTRALFTDTNPIPVKDAAVQLGLCEPVWRLPLCPPPAGVSARVRDELDALGML